MMNNTETFMGGNRFFIHEFANSSILKGIKYDTVMSELVVTMKNGSGYRYLGVPEDVVTEFTKAPSAGSFFSSVIAKNGYNYNKIAAL